MANGYVNPAQLFQSEFRSPVDKAIGVIPSFLTDKRGRASLKESQRQFDVRTPLAEAQTELNVEKTREAKLANDLRVAIFGGSGESFTGKSPDEMLSDPIARSLMGFPQQSYDTVTVYGPNKETRRVSAPKGKGYTPPEGWSLKAPPEQTAGERIEEKVDTQAALAPGKLDAYLLQLIRGGKIKEALAVAEYQALTGPTIAREVEKKREVGKVEIGQIPERQKVSLPGELTKATEIKRVTTPFKKQAEEQAWQTYLLGGALTPQQATLIGTDKDPFISSATQLVLQDLKAWRLPLDEKVQRIKDTAEALRKSILTEPITPPPSGETVPPPAGDIATPQTDADYDAIPPGGLFIDPEDGQTYRKPEPTAGRSPLPRGAYRSVLKGVLENQ